MIGTSIRSGRESSSPLSEPLLPTSIHQASFSGVSTYPINTSASSSSPPLRSVLRMRERYILYLTIFTFAIFCVAGFFFLPELKAGTSIAIKRVKETGPDLIGIIPPVEHLQAHQSRISLGSNLIGNNDGLNDQLQANIPAPEYVFPISKPTPRNRMTDMQRLAEKIRNDQMAINRSQNAAVLPRPGLFGQQSFEGANNGHGDLDQQHVIPPPHHVIYDSSSDPSGGQSSFLGHAPTDTQTIERRDKVKSMMKHAWDNYVQFAWGNY